MSYRVSQVSTCHRCHREIPAGLAVVRSVAFRILATCRPCYSAVQR